MAERPLLGDPDLRPKLAHERGDALAVRVLGFEVVRLIAEAPPAEGCGLLLDRGHGSVRAHLGAPGWIMVKRPYCGTSPASAEPTPKPLSSFGLKLGADIQTPGGFSAPGVRLAT